MSSSVSIDPNVSMRDLLQQLPGAQRALFRRYHIGGCSSCGFRPEETLADVCARNENLPVEEVIAHLLASHEGDLKLQISPEALSVALRQEPTARLIDVRTREEFDAVHIEGAIFFTQELMNEAMARWDRKPLLAIIDHHGTRSLDAAAYFAGHGFENAKSVQGGIDAWSRQVDPALPRYELE